MPSPYVADLSALVRQEKEALAHNDWLAFREAHHAVDSVLDGLMPRKEDVPALQSLLSELDVILDQLATKHRITGTLLRNLGIWTKRTGRVISGSC